MGFGKTIQFDNNIILLKKKSGILANGVGWNYSVW